MYRQSVALLSLLAAVAQAANGWSCKDNQSAYPYCVYVQGQNAPDGGAWPTMMFLPGSGARGDASQANYLVGYDGHGKMVQRYLDGTRSGPEQIAAEQFLTIVPIASMSANTRHFDPDKILAILNEVKASYNVDSERCYISGFSMGARGTWRSLVFHPEIWAAGAPSAGAAENTGASTLSQEYALATFPSLNKVLNIPIRQFDGLSDTTAGFKDPQSTQAEIVKLGGKLSTLTEMSGKDHSAMSTAPWTDTDLLSWFLKQQRSGGTSSPSTKTSAPSATQVDSGKGGHASQSPVATDSDGSDGEGEDDEDCDDDEEDEDEYDEDCDEGMCFTLPFTSLNGI